jgi:hypothetical protein
MNTRNIFLYWVGKEYTLISILRKLIYLHSTNGKGYTVHLINHNNIKDYIKDLPDCFYKLQPAHQADFVRVSVVCEYGGIWLDSDTLVLDSLDSLFDVIENKNGFFIIQNNTILCNGVFGSKANTEIMIKWKSNIIKKLDDTNGNIKYVEIGNAILKNMYSENINLYENYTIFNGLDNVYPVNWDKCVSEYINKPYDNYKNIIKDYQPFLILVNSAYRALEHMTIEEILSDNKPINYFINKSFENHGKYNP